MLTWSLIVWLSVGAVVGLFARRYVGGTAPYGKAGDIALGIAGGVIGGFLLSLTGLGATAGSLIVTILAALGGAVLLIWLANFVKTKSV